jgi:hypothetical protein
MSEYRDHDPMSSVSGKCPSCGAKIKFTFRNFSKPVALAVYDGIPGGRPNDDVEMLRRIAAWLDHIDDAADLELKAVGSDHRVRDGEGPTIQDDLRRIADKVEKS